MPLTDFLLNLNVLVTVIVFILHLRFTNITVPANQLLSIQLFGGVYISLLLFLYRSGLVVHFPHLLGTGIGLSLVLIPAAYLYIRKVVNREGWLKRDFVHFIPLLLYVIDYSPFFFADTAIKEAILCNELNKQQLFLLRRTLFLPDHSHLYFWIGMSSSYFVLIIRLFCHRFWGEANRLFRLSNAKLLTWLIVLTALITADMLVLFILALTGSSAESIWRGGLSMCFINFGFIVLMLRPKIKIIKSILWLEPDAKPVPCQVLADAARTQMSLIPEFKVNTIRNLVDVQLITNKKYLDKNYSLDMLSRETGLSRIHLSSYINQHIGLSFREYLNQLRINHILAEVEKDDRVAQFTIEAMAEQAGYNNRFSFLNAFKKVTGKTPSAHFQRRK